MEFFKITEQDIENAKTYVGLGEKQAFVGYASAGCFEPLRITLGDDESRGDVPSMYKENTATKNRYLMGAFVRLYLGREYVPVEGDEWLMSQDDYDRYAGGHIFNQIERFKSNPKLRDICFDLIQDYKDLEKRMNTEVFSLLQVMNDPITRLVKHMEIVASPEHMQKAISELESTKDDIEKFIAEKKGE